MKQTKLAMVILPPFFIFLFLFAHAIPPHRQNNDPWRQDQLMQPSELAAIINNPHAKKPLIYSIGIGSRIKGFVDFGPAGVKENLEKLKAAVSKFPRDTAIVIYCGCCPFEHCPNVRPAFTLLSEMKFTNVKLLNLSHNFKIDWIDKGYPMN